MLDRFLAHSSYTGRLFNRVEIGWFRFRQIFHFPAVIIRLFIWSHMIHEILDAFSFIVHYKYGLIHFILVRSLARHAQGLFALGTAKHPVRIIFIIWLGHIIFFIFL